MAIMRIDQAANSVPGGTNDKARNDIWKDQPVDLVSTDDATCTWELLSKPPGSASVLSAGSGTPVTVTPDAYGTYRVLLTDSSGNHSLKIFRVKRDNVGVLANRGWAYPAVLECSHLLEAAQDLAEANYGTNDRGYDEEMRVILEDVRTHLDTIDAMTPFSLTVEVPFVVGEQFVEKHAFERIGARKVSMASYPVIAGLTRTVKFVVDLDIGGLATNAEIKLFNITDNEDVTGTDLTETSTDSTEQASAALTVGSAAGNIRSDHPAQYAVYLKMNGGTEDTDQVFCTGARLVISYA